MLVRLRRVGILGALLGASACNLSSALDSSATLELPDLDAASYLLPDGGYSFGQFQTGGGGKDSGTVGTGGQDAGTIQDPGSAPNGVDVGPQGATVQNGAATLSVPGGALSAPQRLAIVETSAAGPDGFQMASPVYQLTPDGLTLSTPAALSLPVVANGKAPELYAVDAQGHVVRLDGTVKDGAIGAPLAQLRKVFVGRAPVKASAKVSFGSTLARCSDGPFWTMPTTKSGVVLAHAAWTSCDGTQLPIELSLQVRGFSRDSGLTGTFDLAKATTCDQLSVTVTLGGIYRYGTDSFCGGDTKLAPVGTLQLNDFAARVKSTNPFFAQFDAFDYRVDAQADTLTLRALDPQPNQAASITVTSLSLTN